MVPSFVVAPYAVAQGLKVAVTAAAVSDIPAEFKTTMVFDVADTTLNVPLLTAFVKPLNET
jgi:hypothetical protein